MKDETNRNERTILFRLLLTEPEKALSSIYRRYASVLIRYISFYVQHDQSLVRQITLEAFEVLWKQRASIARKNDPFAWLLRIARNIAISRLRGNKQWLVLREDETLCSRYRAELHLERKELEKLLQAAIATLTAQQKTIFTLSKIDGLKNREIAEQMKLREQTVRNQLSAALKRLRVVLGGTLKSF